MSLPVTPVVESPSPTGRTQRQESREVTYTVPGAALGTLTPVPPTTAVPRHKPHPRQKIIRVDRMSHCSRLGMTLRWATPRALTTLQGQRYAETTRTAEEPRTRKTGREKTRAR